MKIKLIIFFLFSSICYESFAQTQKSNIFFCGYGANNNSIKLCNFLQNNFNTNNNSAENAVDKILKPLGLPRNFVLVRCPNIDNAIAITSSDGIRYIVYDKAFMEKISKSTNACQALVF